MHEIICPWIQYMNLLHFLFKEEVALKVFIWERKNKDISVKTRTFARPLSWWLCCWCWWGWGGWLGPPLPHCLTTPCWWWSEMYGVSRGRTTLQEKYQANYESVFRQRVNWLCALVLAKLAPSPHFFGDKMSLNATPKSQQKNVNQQ